jgi:hypothetical protein
MKKFILLLLIITGSINSFSQNLTLDNVLQLKMSKTEDIVKALEAKDWRLFEFEKGKFISYLYEKDEEIKSVITFYKDPVKKGIGSTLLVTYSTEKYLSYKKRIVSSKWSLEKIYYENGNKVEEYKLNIWTIQIKVNADDTRLQYELFIL